MNVRVSTGDADMFLDEFRVWLGQERGLSPETVRCYGKQGRTFLGQLPRPLDISVQQLDSGQVVSVVVGYCRDRNTGSAKVMVTALRAFLRFLHVSGHTLTALVAAVAAVAGWRLASLPRGLDAAVVARLLECCDRTTIVGRRDYAMLTMLARLGLRGAEATALKLGDIDWRSGEITVHGKGNRVDRLPVPVDVGEAIVAYLTNGRPTCGMRALFCTVGAPYRPLTAAAVRQVMARACQRAGQQRVGAHRLRHSLATDMLRAGASLPEVGQILRHRSELSTAIYAKVDENALRPLARPWPTGTRP
ncbi:MAG TPA: site-specific integrase [Mycobacterium sp.]|nr:site-specific integrase [Mycobacterium sp.]HUH72464.1 site-specific integrase [Mycobacterium sp.]